MERLDHTGHMSTGHGLHHPAEASAQVTAKSRRGWLWNPERLWVEHHKKKLYKTLFVQRVPWNSWNDPTEWLCKSLVSLLMCYFQFSAIVGVLLNCHHQHGCLVSRYWPLPVSLPPRSALHRKQRDAAPTRLSNSPIRACWCIRHFAL